MTAELMQRAFALGLVFAAEDGNVHTDTIAERFVSVFERHLASADWQSELGTDELQHFASTLSRL